jgi:hypothetical protein
MTNPLGAADFFALEAGECLDHLEHLVTAKVPPQGEEFLRLARVLRGSALMASQTQIARAAAVLEVVARAYRDHRLSWSAALQEQAAQSVEEFRLLVRSSREWTEADTGRALRLGRSLEGLTGSSPDISQSIAGSGGERQELHTGVRAFVAREGALIASALDRAARSLRVAPSDREPLYNVIRRMQSLRGLAELGDLVPLPEILDGIELAVGDLTRLFAPPPGVDEVMDAAGRALTRISRDVAEHGRPVPDAEEAAQFTELLLRAFAVERDVVPIESLYFEGHPDSLTRSSSQPQFGAPEPLGPLELVSHGEHLCQSADLIARARSAIERDLRFYHLLGALRSAAPPSTDPVAEALGIFARSAQEALAAGVASRSVDGLVSRIREAGELLRGIGEADDRMQVSRRLLDVAHRLDRLREEPDAEISEPSGEPVPIESLGFEDESDVVPVESLAPSPTTTEKVGGLELSFRTFSRLRRERRTSSPSLAVLLGQPASPAAAPVTAQKTREKAEEEPAVAIDSLCYRGHAALERAVVVRHQLAAQLNRDAPLESLQPLLQELLDLVPMALVES